MDPKARDALGGKVSESFKRANPQIYGNVAQAPAVAPGATQSPSPMRGPIRQDAAPNKAEQAAFDYLSGEFGAIDKIEFHGLTLRIANGVKYTPDICITYADGSISLYEVKAMRGRRVHIEDDSSVKVKAAAAKWRMFKFFLIWYDKTHRRHLIQGVNP